MKKTTLTPNEETIFRIYKKTWLEYGLTESQATEKAMEKIASVRKLRKAINKIGFTY